MQWADYMQPLSYKVPHTFTLQQVARYLAVHQLTTVIVMKESVVIGVIEQQTIIQHIDHLQTLAEEVITPIECKLLSELSDF